MYKRTLFLAFSACIISYTAARPAVQLRRQRLPLMLPLAEQPFDPMLTNYQGIDNIVSFGDSLTDNGNGTFKYLNESRPSPEGYWNGRWSNGLVWVEYLAQIWNANLTDLAYGSSTSNNEFIQGNVQDVDNTNYTVPGMLQQVQSYINQTDLRQNANTTVYTLWSGHNDYLTTVDNGSFIDIFGTLSSRFHRNVASGVIQSAQALVDAGAIYVTVLELAPVQDTPSAQDYNFLLKCTLKQVVDSTNEDLADGIEDLDNVHLFKTSKAFGGVIDGSASSTITSVDSPCLINFENYTQYPFDNNATAVVCENPNATLFWDYVHPTTAGHFELAQIFSQWLSSILAGNEESDSDD